MNQLISSAVGEKLAALLAEDYLKERAGRGSRRRYDSVLRKVQDAPPVEGDELPNKRMQQTRSARPTKSTRRPRS